MYDFELNLTHARRGVELAQMWARAVPMFLSDEPASPDIHAVSSEIAKYIRRSGSQRATILWRVAELWLRILEADQRLRQLALTGSGGVAEERERLTVLIHEVIGIQRRLTDPGLVSRLGALIDPGTGRVLREQSETILSRLPLPTLYLRIPSDSVRRRRIGPEVPPEGSDPVPVLRLICDLDSSPLVSPQLLRPGPLYSLSFRVRGVRWPTDAGRLHIRLLSTCPRECYSISDLIMPRPATASEGAFEGVLTGQLRFPAAQSGTASTTARV